MAPVSDEEVTEHRQQGGAAVEPGHGTFAQVAQLLAAAAAVRVNLVAALDQPALDRPAHTRPRFVCAYIYTTLASSAAGQQAN